MSSKINLVLYSFGKDLGKNGESVGTLAIVVSFLNLFAVLFGLIAFPRITDNKKAGDTGAPQVQDHAAEFAQMNEGGYSSRPGPYPGAYQPDYGSKYSGGEHLGLRDNYA